MLPNESSYSRSLYELAAALNSPRSSHDVINSIVEGVARAMNARGCALMLLTPDEKTLLHTAAFGLSDWFVRKGPVVVDESMAETLRGNPLVVLDATADDKVQFHKQLKREGIVSVLSVPVTLREKVIGIMRIYTSVPRQFNDADVSFARMAANFGAIALESAQFYNTMEKDYDSFRQDLLQWRAELGDEWMMEPSVIPGREPAFKIPPGG
jgi:signal transduction protein with GAF and PtsI domain